MKKLVPGRASSLASGSALAPGRVPAFTYCLSQFRLPFKKTTHKIDNKQQKLIS